MEDNKRSFTTIDEYIMLYPKEIQEILHTLRKVIQDSAPGATEKISWQMPTFYLHGNLVHFAAAKNHIGLYPGANGVSVFESRLTDFKTSKGAIQFPINKPLPYELVSDIVKFRVTENLKLLEEKVQKQKSKKK